MQISIVIVNYNVKHFLEQCLFSVQKAIQDIDAEVFIIDNNSTDNSVAYLKNIFPTFYFVENKENVGFAKACNQELGRATGEFILFLNPDVLVPEDCFTKCINFFRQTPDAGAIGIKMVDGNGNFLKESKRAYPSPLTSLFKLTGLAALFPRSAFFAKYYLGHLPTDNNHPIGVIAGAFMMIKKSVLDIAGSFDEQFFMYGEDVDLSYRIEQAGFKNYYFAESTIIHFKGESTKKGNLNYVKMFYNAMNIFVKKHYKGSKASLYVGLIQLAIWLRAVVSFGANVLKKLRLPLIDALIILVSFWLIKTGWGIYIKPTVHYDDKLLSIALPSFTALYLITAYYAGLYDRHFKLSELIKPTIIATLVLLAVYALLPEKWRFSRGIIFLGAAMAFVLMWLYRIVLLKMNILKTTGAASNTADAIIIGTAQECNKALEILGPDFGNQKLLGRAGVIENDLTAITYWQNINQLTTATPSIKEIIFCIGSLSYKEVIEYLPKIKNQVTKKFFNAGSQSIVGSFSKDSSGEWHSSEIQYQLSNPYNKRLKRLLDVAFALAGILFFPIHLLLIKNPFKFFSNCFYVLIGGKTWVGYIVDEKKLPSLPKGVLSCNGLLVSEKQVFPSESLAMMSHWYARDYTPRQDVKIIMTNYKKLGS